MRGEQAVALAFMTNKENLCEVRQVNDSNTTWVLVSMMPCELL